MFFFAHLGIPLFLSDFIFRILQKNKDTENNQTQRWSQNKLSLLPFIFGTFLPDIVDKVISQPLIGTGRFLGHTLALVGVVSIIVVLMFGSKLGISVFAGSFIHLFLDSEGFVPWFWPLLSYEFTPTSSVFLRLNQILTEPVTLFFEFLGIAAIVFLIRKYPEDAKDVLMKIKKLLYRLSLKTP